MVEHAGDIHALDLMDMLKRGPVVLDIRIDHQVRIANNARFDLLSAVSG